MADNLTVLGLTLDAGKQQMLTSHFVQNYGAHYKYVVSVGSKGFSEAPDPVLRALLRMRWAGHQVIEHAKMSISQLQGNGKVEVAPSLGFDFVEFNELLALGYFEGNKINVSDGSELKREEMANDGSGMMTARIHWAQPLPQPPLARLRLCHSGQRLRLRGSESLPTARCWICSCSTEI